MHVSHNSSNSNNNNNSNIHHNTKVYLSCEQTEKLKHVLDRPIPICASSPSSYPTLNLTPRNFLRQVLCKLKEHSIDITSIRLNGGAASYVLVNESNFVYRDIDILIHIKTPLSSEQKTTLFSSNNEPYLCDVWTIIKYIISSCLLEHIASIKSNDQQSQQYTHHYLSTVLDTYAKKNIKISSEHDSWALLSLQNYNGKNLELKFVEHLKRQWQFSVDSFQINLEPLLYEKQINNHSNRNPSRMYSCSSISSITKTIKTKNLIIDAINGLTIIKNDYDDDEKNDLKNSNEKIHQNNIPLTSTSPLRFGFFTPSSSPHTIQEESDIECQTLATITTISTSNNNNNTNNNSNNSNHESRSRLSKVSTSTINEETTDSSLQFHLSLNDDTDDGIVSDADDSANEDDDQVFRTPVDTNSAPPSPATIIAIELPLPLPRIEVYSGYKDINQALDHLNKRLIATDAPETMRGGGLLKYCDLLAQNYKVYDRTDMVRMQRYMCSRFFIDYKTIAEQVHAISQYVTTHFLPLALINSDPLIMQNRENQQNQKTSSTQNNNQNHVNSVRLCLLFFDHLYTVIRESTVCLTHHDKEATLININNIKEHYHYKYESLFINDSYHQQQYHSNLHHYHHCSSSSSNSSRSSSPSSSSSNSYRYYRSHHNQNNHRHQNSHYRYHHHHNFQRQPTHTLSYHPGPRNYSNDFHTNQSMLTNHHYHQQRRQ